MIEHDNTSTIEGNDAKDGSGFEDVENAEDIGIDGVKTKDNEE